MRLLAEITSGALARTVWPSSVRMDVYSISDMALAFQRSCMGDCCSTNCSPNLPLSQGPDKSLEAPKKKGDPRGSPLCLLFEPQKLLSVEACLFHVLHELVVEVTQLVAQIQELAGSLFHCSLIGVGGIFQGAQL